MRRLFPEPGSVAPEDAYASLGLEQLAPPDRPYVIANMVTTVDGRATLGGRTKAISSAADRALFHSLREQVDAVIAGTGTIALERYGPLVREEERRQRRVARGLEPAPLAVTATRSLELPVDTPLFQDPGSRIVVLTNSDRELSPTPAQVIVEQVRGPSGDLDLVAGLGVLRRTHGVRTVLVEGGPTMLGAMFEAGLVDELFLTIAAVIAARAEIGIVEGASLLEPISLRLLGLLEDESFLFVRYGVGERD